MSHPGLSAALATTRTKAIRVPAVPSRRSGRLASRREMETRLATLQKDYAELHTALFEAAQVYRRLCAPRLIHHGDFEIASEVFAVRHLPGDFFTVEETSEGIILALGDIEGKGLAAGMWATHLVGLVRTATAAGSEPNAIISQVNRDLCRLSPLAPLTTLFVGRLDSRNGKLDYASAGHPPALLLRNDGKLESLSEGGPILGVVPAASFNTGTIELEDGDVLVAYSDGIIESRDKADQEFGYDRLETQLRRARSSSAEGVLFSVLGAVQDFASARLLVDDTSLVVVRRCS
jgi:serine phosphatase RsbU (regulator of sigma subunit)